MLRNINVRQGLSNGARLIITYLGNDVIQAQVATGPRRDTFCTLSRLPFEYKDADIIQLYHFERIQFPIELAYAMTINKSQGQTVTRLGLSLRNPMALFCHGQLYTAMSRVRTQSSLKIFIERQGKFKDKPGLAKNVLDRTLLS